jgi:hypothetical protein
MDDVEVDAEKGTTTTTTMEVDAEKGTTTTMEPKKKTELLRSMDSSVLRFKNVDFAVGSNENKKLVLDDVSDTVKWGRVLAVCLLCLLCMFVVYVCCACWFENDLEEVCQTKSCRLSANMYLRLLFPTTILGT